MKPNRIVLACWLCTLVLGSLGLTQADEQRRQSGQNPREASPRLVRLINLDFAGGTVPQYIEAIRKIAGDADVREGEAPTGVIVGTAKITECRRENGHYEWHLSGVKRIEKQRKPKGRPQPVWFRPF